MTKALKVFIAAKNLGNTIYIRTGTSRQKNRFDNTSEKRCIAAQAIMADRYYFIVFCKKINIRANLPKGRGAKLKGLRCKCMMTA